MIELAVSRQVFDVQQILWPSAGLLVRNEIGEADVVNGRRTKGSGHAMGPCVGERDTVDRGQQVDAVWRHTELHDPARRREVASREPETAETEVRQRAQQPLGVVWRRFDEDIDVLGKARPAVERHGVPAHHEGFNVPGLQAREQFFEVLRG